jgi:hypothetical protein
MRSLYSAYNELFLPRSDCRDANDRATQTQVERFVALLSGDTQAAIDAVNAEEQNPTACALVDVAYLRGAEIGVARNGDSAFEIVRILVVGIDTAAGIRAVRPSAYFSLFGVTEYAV